MHSDDHTWNIKIIKDRYSFLELSDQQAEQVFLFEKNNIHQGKTFFTDWEDWDYELHFFSQILDKSQLAKFIRKQKKKIRRYVKGLEGQLEEESLKRLNYTTEIITYYEQQLLPGIFSSPLSTGFGQSYDEQSKVDFLKDEYKKFLHESRSKLLINHFKYYRTHCPITLKATLLNHKIYHLLPDYRSFKHRADETAKATAAFLETQLIYLPKEADTFLQSKLKDLPSFFSELTKKYYPEVPVFTYGQQTTPDEDAQERLMMLLLLDRDQYCWNESLLT